MQRMNEHKGNRESIKTWLGKRERQRVQSLSINKNFLESDGNKNSMLHEDEKTMKIFLNLLRSNLFAYAEMNL